MLLPDGTNVNRKLVKPGLAWWYKKYSKDGSLGALEQEAREAKRGLWAEPNPIPPWIYRHPELAKEEKLVAESVAKGLATLPPATPRKEGPIIGNMNSRVYHRHEKERIPLLRLIRTWMAISQYMLWGI